MVGIVLLTPGCWGREGVWEGAEQSRRDPNQGTRETKAAALYRHGVNCMDVIEREECAIDYFEQLVELNPSERQLVGDAIFRLVDLYRRNGEDERAKLLLREYWEIGTARGSAGITPYSTRFLSEDVSVLYMVNMDAFQETPLSKSISADALDYLFTCDEERRAELQAKVDAKREERRKRREAEGKAKPKPKPDESGDPPEPKEERTKPIFDEGMCHVARALGLEDPRDFMRVANASHHEDATESMAVLEIDQLQMLIGSSLANGKIVQESERLYSIAGAEYEGGKVMVAWLDKNDLVLAPEAKMPDIMAAHEHRSRKRLNPELRELIDQVPTDSVFFAVTSKEAMAAGIDQAGAMKLLMPDPDGMVISAVIYDYVGLFVRVPTSDPLKSWLIVSLARNFIQGAQEKVDEDDPTAAMLASMDVSQAPDGKALMMSTVLTAGQVESITMD
jgi:hypothetical protein